MFVVGLTCSKQHLPSAVGISRVERCWSLNKNEPTWRIGSYLGLESPAESEALENLAREWGWHKTVDGWVCTYCASQPQPINCSREN